MDRREQWHLAVILLAADAHPCVMFFGGHFQVGA